MCRALAAWSTALQDWLDNTVRIVARFHGAFAVGRRAVTFLVRAGRRAARMLRRGRPQPIDMQLLAGLGYLPGPVFDSMCLQGASWQPARSERTYPTPRGYVHVEEVEALITYPGGHCAYWCMHVTGHYAGEPPSDSETFSDTSDGESL